MRKAQSARCRSPTPAQVPWGIRGGLPPPGELEESLPDAQPRRDGEQLTRWKTVDRGNARVCVLARNWPFDCNAKPVIGPHCGTIIFGWSSDQPRRFPRRDGTRETLRVVSTSISGTVSVTNCGRETKPTSPTASAYFKYVSIDATTTLASTVIRSIPTSEMRTQASITIPLSSTRSSTSIRLDPPDTRSTAMQFPPLPL